MAITERRAERVLAVAGGRVGPAAGRAAGLVPCRICGALNGAHREGCFDCGSLLRPREAKCSSCGAPTHYGVDECFNCGRQSEVRRLERTQLADDLWPGRVLYVRH